MMVLANDYRAFTRPSHRRTILALISIAGIGAVLGTAVEGLHT